LRERPRIRAFADLGWLAVVFGVYFLVLNVVLDAEQFPIPQFAIYSVAAGVGLVLITNQQEEGSNFFVGIGRGLANIIPTALSSINVFSDTVSYIRLYAVGLASIEIAKSFNAMAGSIGSGVGGIIAAALILALGHTLNLAMGALSVVVHGVRLNVLEFSGHLGMEWTGIPYRPFGKTA
jgi:V/A-type H+-transporting ATPase subunit I